MEKTVLNTSAIQRFTDLKAWQKGHLLVLETYRLSKKYPKEELFCLTNQMRRCVISITSNIAEGFSRRSRNDKNHFNIMALGSTTELQNQLLIAKDLGYMEDKEFEAVSRLTIEVHKLINSLIKNSISYGN